MTILAGQIISAADLNAINSSGLTALRGDIAAEPRWHVLPIQFKGLVTGAADAWKTRDIVIPDDLYIAEIAIQGNNHAGDIVVTLDNGAMVQPVTISATLASGIAKGTRWYADTSKVQQVLYKGSILNCTVTTTNVTATSLLSVLVVCKSSLKDR